MMVSPIGCCVEVIQPHLINESLIQKTLSSMSSTIMARSPLFVQLVFSNIRNKLTNFINTELPGHFSLGNNKG